VRRIRLLLEYDGGAFQGWQRQPTGERTVQGVLEAAFAALPGEHGAVHAAGRTDAGVHALAMVAHVDSSVAIDESKLRLALNAHLPRDVVVLAAERAEEGFEAQFHCRYRRYLYRLRPMRCDARGAAIQRLRWLPVFARLDVDAMHSACAAFRGEHDFAALATRETRSTRRTVHLCELRRERGEVRLHVAADGFLRTMVRTMVGTLLSVGKGALAAEDVPAVLASKDRARAGRNVPPYGLYFVEAGYGPWDDRRSEAAVADLIV
jgi:tRNA pseudouridine38-40 synthase